MNKKDILDLEENLRAEYLADLEAIRRVKRLLDERKLSQLKAVESDQVTSSITPPPPIHHPELPMTNGHETVESKVMKVINGFQGPFKMSDILTALLQDFPAETINPKTVSGVLFRSKDKTIRVVKEGRGRRAAIYTKF
jgi:hypothetical protein